MKALQSCTIKCNATPYSALHNAYIVHIVQCNTMQCEIFLATNCRRPLLTLASQPFLSWPSPQKESQRLTFLFRGKRRTRQNKGFSKLWCHVLLETFASAQLWKTIMIRAIYNLEVESRRFPATVGKFETRTLQDLMSTQRGFDANKCLWLLPFCDLEYGCVLNERQKVIALKAIYFFQYFRIQPVTFWRQISQ